MSTRYNAKNKGCRARSDRSGAPRRRHRAVPLEAGKGNSGRGQQGYDAHLLHGPDEERESPAGLSDNIDDVAPGSGCVVSQPCFVRILGLPSSASWGAASHSLSFNTVTQVNVTNRGSSLHAALPRVLGASGPKPRRSPAFARHEPSAYGRRLRKAPTLALGTFQGDPGGSIAGSAIHGDPIREPAFPTN